MAAIRLDNVVKFYGDGPAAVDDVSLEVDDGEFLVLVGPSGCGKSTLLRIIAGLEDVTTGEVWVGERQVTDLPPKDRDIAMVFQNYALYPHMTVAQNIGFGLRLRKTPKAESATRIADVARLLALDGLLDRKPSQLSGGQRQRVAMGRAMVREPLALLMDEPLSNLDAKLRVQMRAELNRLHTRLATTTVYVTHDQIEAMTLGDRVAVLRDGVLQQLDTPHALFHEPTNLFVAAFIGSPSMNLLDASVSVSDDRPVLTVAGQVVRAPLDAQLGDYVGRRVVLGVRPTDFAEADSQATAGWPGVDVTVDAVEELGTEMNILFRLGSAQPTGDSTPIINLNSDLITAPAAADLDAEFSDVLTATVGPRTRLRPGDRTRLAVDVTRMHLFDPLSGNALPSR